MIVPIVTATLVWALIAYFFFPGGVVIAFSVGAFLGSVTLLTDSMVTRPKREYEELKANAGYKFLDDDGPLPGPAE